MRTLLLAGIVGVILFAASASASWFLLNQNKLAEDAHKVAAVDPDHDPSHDPGDDPAHDAAPEIKAGVPPMGHGIKKEDQLPVALRPEVPLTVEAVLELGESIRRKERDLIAREKAADKTEQNIQLLFEDLKVERAELTALAESIDAKLQLTQGSVAELKQENQTLTTQTQEIAKLNQQKTKTKSKPGAKVELDAIGLRVQTAKPWFEGLEDEQAAKYLKNFANNGELKFVARLLGSLDDRKASKILAALDDAVFAQQILDASMPAEEVEAENKDGGTARRETNGALR